MALWTEFLRWLMALRSSCTRRRTFAWMVLIVAGFAARPDLAGVTSFGRGGRLPAAAYHRLLTLFRALRLPELTQAWARLAVGLFDPVTVGDHIVCLADGLKVPKEGKKMPAVKSLHEESGNNSKPEFIMDGALIPGRFPAGPRRIGADGSRPPRRSHPRGRRNLQCQPAQPARRTRRPAQ